MFTGRSSLGPEDARSVLACLSRGRSGIDGSLEPVLLPVLRGGTREDYLTCLAEDFAGSNHEVASLWFRHARSVWRAESNQTTDLNEVRCLCDRVWRLDAKTDDRSRTPVALNRMRLLCGVGRLLPRVVPGPQALELLGELRERAGLERDPVDRTELLIAVAEAAERVADPGAMALVESVLRAAEAQVRSSLGAMGFEALDAVANAAARLDGGERAWETVSRVADLAREALSRPGSSWDRAGGLMFFPARSLLRCARLAMELGRPEAAVEWATRAGDSLAAVVLDGDLKDMLPDILALPEDGPLAQVRERLVGRTLEADRVFFRRELWDRVISHLRSRGSRAHES